MGCVQNGERRVAVARILTATVLLIVPIWIAGSGIAQAAEDPTQKKSRSWTRQYDIDELTKKRLDKARELLGAQQFVEADAALDRLRVRSLNAKEKTKLYELRAWVAQGRVDYPAAREFFELAIAQGFVDGDKRADMRFRIAAICMQEENWVEAIANFEKWFVLEKDPNSTAYYFLALAHWQNGDPDAALEPALKAVSLSDEPHEGWLQILLAVRLTRKEYRESIPVLDQLIRRFPKKTYWIQLSTLHGALGNYEESLIPLQLAFTQELLTEDAEIRRLAELLLFLELPYRAAGVMQSGLEKQIVELDSDYYELLSNSWIMAREYDKAVDPLIRAAELADDGRIYQRLAEVHIQRERWKEAAEALGLAIEKGDLPKPGQAKLLMGIALYSQKKPDQALDWFGRAKKHSDTEHEAEIWQKHIQREMTADS